MTVNEHKPRDFYQIAEVDSAGNFVREIAVPSTDVNLIRRVAKLILAEFPELKLEIQVQRLGWKRGDRAA